MSEKIELQTRVLPGNRVEVSSPELREGDLVSVIVVLPQQSEPPESAIEFLDALPAGPRAFKSWQEYDAHLQQERDAWDRS